MDLHLDVSGGRVRAGLEGALREAVRSGRLAPGLRLPSSRALAGDLGVARNTVADAYGQLVAEGWLVARQGSGTRVADRATAVRDATLPTTRGRPPRFDLRPGAPDVSLFPRSAWQAAARRAWAAAPPEALGYGDPRGRPELREALAGYLSRARGVQATADRMVVCSGFGQALGLVCQVLRNRGAQRFALERYGHRLHRRIVSMHGLAPLSLDVDADGAVLDQLGDDTAGVLLTPAHQFPLGGALAPRRRAAAVEWAARTSGVVVEDDYDGEFRYDRHPVGALQALAPEQVVYAGTASKSLAPALRLAWLVLPVWLIDDIVAAKELADGATGSLDQLALAELITNGDYDRQVRRARLVYRRRRDRLVAAIRHQAPEAQVSGIAAGQHLLLALPKGLSEEEAVARASRRDLALEALGTYTDGPQPRPPALVVGYGRPPEHAFTAALARLTTVLTETGLKP